MINHNLKTRKILSYDDLVQVLPGESQEPIIDVVTYDSSIINQYKKFDMSPYTGQRMFVRDTLARKLATANTELQSVGKGLKIVYAYRHPEVQRAYFERQKEIVKEQTNLRGKALGRQTHLFVAAPEIAGHTMGAAVDVTLVDKDGYELDMGTNIADFRNTETIRTFSKYISKQQLANRMLLHNAMVAQEFAPFYGEWWHFSYGDREWAAFYKKEALYGEMNFRLEVTE